jgi:3-oxoadipate enol-lactonase
MPFVCLNGVTLHYQYLAGTGTPIVFLNSLGTDFRIWDQVIAQIDMDVCILRLDMRGHGLSDDGPISMDHLVSDVAALMGQLGLTSALICGVSVGGMIAQGLALECPERVAGLVLCCTGAKIGDTAGWNARIEAVQNEGISSISEAVLERWFSHGFKSRRTEELAGHRNMLIRTSNTGYCGVCAAIRDSDFTARSPNIAVPTLCIAGQEDLATPPALVEALAQLIPQAHFETIEGCGHLPCIEAPDAVAKAIRQITGQLA